MGFIEFLCIVYMPQIMMSVWTGLVVFRYSPCDDAGLPMSLLIGSQVVFVIVAIGRIVLYYMEQRDRYQNVPINTPVLEMEDDDNDNDGGPIDLSPRFMETPATTTAAAEVATAEKEPVHCRALLDEG